MTTTLSQMPSSISLPPISSINGQHHPMHTHSASHDMPQHSNMPPARTLPPLPGYYTPMHSIPQPEYVQQARHMYSGPGYGVLPVGNRMALPSSIDAAGIIGYAPSRHTPKAKEVKRRTKTGCMTCRKRRIKCGEEKPQCRNCVKSKRQCAGYDPVFQAQSSQSIQPAPVTPSAPAASTTQRSSSHTAYTNHETLSPTASNQSQNNSGTTSSPREHLEYSYHRSAELANLPNINQSYKMGNRSAYTSPHLSRYSYIEDVCAVNGHRGRDVPALRPDLVPNFSEIQKVYDTFFAPGLDGLIESGPIRWFTFKGFSLLTSDRTLLAQFMLYLTLISGSQSIDPSVTLMATMLPQQAELASQEARMVWSLLNLVVRQAQEGINDEDVDRLARRVKALEALLTSEPVVRTGSMSDFVYQDPEPEPDPDGMDVDNGGIPTVANNPLLDKPFNKQLVARSNDFWQLIEKASERPAEIPADTINRLRRLRDGLEQRDIVYSILLLGSDMKNGQATRKINDANAGRSSHNSSPNRLALDQEKRQAERLLESEARGKATNTVFQNVAGMGLRAFVR